MTPREINEYVRLNQRAVIGSCSVCKASEIVFTCEGKCEREFCRWHAHNSVGYCPHCLMLSYPDGAIRRDE